MKKFLKIFSIVLLLLIILIVALPFMFKGKLIEIAKEQANANLNAQVDFGEFDLSIFSSFPDFLFEINDVSVKNTGKFEGRTLASIGKLNLEVDLMSVISGSDIEIKTIEIVDPSFDVIVLADSSANYDITKATEGDEEVEEETTEESAPFRLGLQKLKITNANLKYEDQTMDFTTEVNNLNLDMSGDFTADNTAMELIMGLDTLQMTYDGVDYFKNASFSTELALDADLANSKYTCVDCAVDLNELGIDFDGWVALNDDDSYDMDLKFGSRETTFKSILSMVPAVYTRDFASVKTDGKLTLGGMAKGKYTDTSYPAFNLDVKIADAMFRYPDLPKAAKNIQMDLNLSNPGGNEDNTLVDLKKFHVEMAGNPVDVKMRIATPISDANIDGWFKGEIDLTSIKDIIPMEEGESLNGIIKSDVTIKGKLSTLEKEQYEDFQCEGNLSITDMLYESPEMAYSISINNMGMSFSPKFVELTAFDSKIGKTDVQAAGKLENFLAYQFGNDEVIVGVFNVSSTLMDLNEFMEEDEEAAAGEGEPAPAEDEVPLEVIEIPASIDFVMQSDFKKVIYDNIEIDNLKGELIARNQKLTMNNVSMNMLGGSATLSGFYETTNINEPTIDMKMSLKGMDVEQTAQTFNTVEKMAPIIKYCKGKYSTDLVFSGALDEHLEPKMNTLSGDGGMLTQNIIVEGFKPMVKVAEALKNKEMGRMIIGNSNLSFEFKDGRVLVKPFDVKLGKQPATIEGSNGFDQTIDYKMNMEIPRSNFGGAANSVLDNLTKQATDAGVDVKLGDKIPVTVQIGGTIDKPKIVTDLKEVASQKKEEVKEQVKEKVKEEIDKGKEKAKEELNKEIEKILADAKKQADQVRREGKSAADQVRKEGYAQADKLVADAKNPIAKKAAEVAAKKLRKETDDKAAKIEAEANKKADGIEAAAQKKADALRAKAEAQ